MEIHMSHFLSVRIGLAVVVCCVTLPSCGPFCSPSDHCDVVDGEIVCHRGYTEGSDDDLDECVRAVDYEITCDMEAMKTGVVCHGPDDRSTFASGNDKSITCVWHCANFKGQEDIYVSLTFWAWDGGCYEPDSEYVSSGICG